MSHLCQQLPKCLKSAQQIRVEMLKRLQTRTKHYEHNKKICISNHSKHSNMNWNWNESHKYQMNRISFLFSIFLYFHFSFHFFFYLSFFESVCCLLHSWSRWIPFVKKKRKFSSEFDFGCHSKSSVKSYKFSVLVDNGWYCGIYIKCYCLSLDPDTWLSSLCILQNNHGISAILVGFTCQLMHCFVTEDKRKME